jgi:hypothetical protein
MPTSMMTFESNQVQGSEAILQKLKSVGRLSHSVQTIDVQPSYSENCILVYVTGTVSIDGGNALHFGEMFQLVASAPGQYYVHSEYILCLLLCDSCVCMCLVRSIISVLTCSSFPSVLLDDVFRLNFGL